MFTNASWNDGNAICVLVNSLKPGIINMAEFVWIYIYLEYSIRIYLALYQITPLERIQTAIAAAERELGVVSDVSPHDFISLAVDADIVIDYVTLLKDKAASM